jgi:hypothetical protein
LSSCRNRGRDHSQGQYHRKFSHALLLPPEHPVRIAQAQCATACKRKSSALSLQDQNKKRALPSATPFPVSRLWSRLSSAHHDNACISDPNRRGKARCG